MKNGEKRPTKEAPHNTPAIREKAEKLASGNAETAACPKYPLQGKYFSTERRQRGGLRARIWYGQIFLEPVQIGHARAVFFGKKSFLPWYLDPRDALGAYLSRKLPRPPGIAWHSFGFRRFPEILIPCYFWRFREGAGVSATSTPPVHL